MRRQPINGLDNFFDWWNYLFCALLAFFPVELLVPSCARNNAGRRGLARVGNMQLRAGGGGVTL